MCIIAYKPIDKEMFSDKILENCWSHHGDGAGFLLNRNGKIHGYKGFMTLADLKDALKKANIKKEEALAIHFRTGTSGGLTKGNTHPFPISSTGKMLHKTTFTCNRALMHNGVVGKGEKHFSDTAVWVRDLISKIKNINSTKAYELVEKTRKGGRILIWDKDTALFWGDWVEDKGYYFSNSSYSYKAKKVVYDWSKYKPSNYFSMYDIYRSVPATVNSR